MSAASTLTLDQTPIAPKYMDDATPPTPWTVQGAIDKTPVGQFLDNYKLTFNMYAEASYSYNFGAPLNHFNYDRVFDVDDQHVDLNQVDFQFGRAVATSGNAYDVGFLVDALYGTDGRFIHSNGLDFYGIHNGGLSPAQQWDLEQAYATVYAPWGNGVNFTIGKFATLLGYETINPTTNPLFSHTYSFGFAIPFTNTGVTAKYQLNNQWTATLGFTRGWDQALKDDNGDDIDVIGQLAYASGNVKGLTGDINFISGPESPNAPGTGVNRYWRSVVEGILSYAWGDNWTFATDAVLGYEPHSGFNGSAGYWYGDSLYAIYKFNSYLSATGRVEYFNDDDGARGLGAEVYEATAGVEITPFPTNQYLASLLFRPELREDWSNKTSFDAGTKYNQTTLAAELIYKF
jgi:hypothetical protein